MVPGQARDALLRGPAAQNHYRSSVCCAPIGPVVASPIRVDLRTQQDGPLGTPAPRECREREGYVWAGQRLH